MEAVLFAGFARGDTQPLAKGLIKRFGGFAEALSADPDDLVQVPGLGVAGTAALKTVREAALRLMKAELRERPVIGSWDKLIDYCRAHVAYGKVEKFHLLFLDRKNALIAHEQQQRGTVDHTPVYTREVVKRALELGASALILVHNHPSGDPTPSKADIAVTRDIVSAAKPLARCRRARPRHHRPRPPHQSQGHGAIVLSRFPRQPSHEAAVVDHSALVKPLADRIFFVATSDPEPQRTVLDLDQLHVSRDRHADRCRRGMGHLDPCADRTLIGLEIRAPARERRPIRQRRSCRRSRRPAACPSWDQKPCLGRYRQRFADRQRLAVAQPRLES
jgi:DNA repair protein RadC